MPALFGHSQRTLPHTSQADAFCHWRRIVGSYALACDLCDPLYRHSSDARLDFAPLARLLLMVKEIANRQGLRSSMATQTVPLSGLARRLVEDGILDADTAQTASEDARKAGLAFVSFLIRNELANPRSIATSASEEFGVPIIDLVVLRSRFDPEGSRQRTSDPSTQRAAADPSRRSPVRRGVGSDESAGARRDQVPHRASTPNRSSSRKTSSRRSSSSS